MRQIVCSIVDIEDILYLLMATLILQIVSGYLIRSLSIIIDKVMEWTSDVKNWPAQYVEINNGNIQIIV